MKRQRTTAAVAVAIALSSVVAACASNGRTADLPQLDAVIAPVFQQRPADLAESPQLAALTVRDTAGLPSTAAAADGSLLPEALRSLASIENPPTALTGITINAGYVYFTFNEAGIAGRSVSANYRIFDGLPSLTLSEPTFREAVEFPVAAVDPHVPGELSAALAEQFPLMTLTYFALSADLSHGFGLVWNLQMEDARGTSATIFAERDGTIIAVDDA